MNHPRENRRCALHVQTQRIVALLVSRISLGREFADGDKTDGSCQLSVRFIPPERVDEFTQIGCRTLSLTRQDQNGLLIGKTEVAITGMLEEAQVTTQGPKEI